MGLRVATGPPTVAFLILLHEGGDGLSGLSGFGSGSGSSVSFLSSIAESGRGRGRGSSSGSDGGSGSGRCTAGHHSSLVRGPLSDLKPFCTVVAGLSGWQGGRGGRE